MWDRRVWLFGPNAVRRRRAPRDVRAEGPPFRRRRAPRDVLAFRRTQNVSGRRRRRPNAPPPRLPEWAYEERNQPVLFTMCTANRRSFLTRPAIARLVVRAVHENAQIYGVHVFAYCIMPDHLHLVATVAEEGGNTRRFAEGVKRTTGYSLRDAGIEPPIWQRGYWDRHARSGEDLGTQIEYVLANPVRAGWCERPEDWPCSAFFGYSG